MKRRRSLQIRGQSRALFLAFFAFSYLSCLPEFSPVRGDESEQATPGRDWTPGKEEPFVWPGLRVPLKVFLPKNYDPSRQWPVIFYYHGTGGRPTTRLMQRYTRETDFIIVGMTYILPEGDALSQPGLDAEIRNIEQIRRELSRDLNIAPKTYVGGFSKGGWMADLLANQPEFPEFKGALIMGAGRFPGDLARARRMTPAAASAGRDGVASIYIGIGQRDANYVYSLRARDYYRKREARVTFDEYLGRAHETQVAPESDYLMQWLAIEATVRQEEKVALAERARTWWDASLQQADDLTDPLVKYLYLERVLHAPYSRLVSPEDRRALQQRLQRAAGHPAVAHVLGPATRYQALLRRESAFERSAELVDLAKTYLEFFEENRSTYFGKRAALDAVRLWNNFQILQRSRSDSDDPLEFPKPDIPSEIAAEFQTLAEGLTTVMPR